MRKVTFLLLVLLFSISVFAQEGTEGALFAIGKRGKELGACPLKSTRVTADISGFLARVTVVQEFENNFTEPIEAVYTFPLSQNSAVDDMTMKIGERIVRGRIMKREEARKVYDAAKNEGKTASLLDQERPNIFTQSVANILPNEKIVIEISYVEMLKYEDGVYEFVFPMVVGPRYIPGSVKDANKVSPPIAATRAGHTIWIDVNLDAGVPVEEIRSNSHEIETQNLSATGAKISLKDAETIPNKDFILRYDVSGKRIEDAILTHHDERGGFFSLILQPPDKFAYEDVTPKEIVFVLDTSGSMSGFPIEKAKEAMKMSLEGLNPYDTFNLITFAGDTSILFDKPVPATQANLERANEFLENEGAGGGTEMMKAVKAALDPTDSQEHLRIVCFMTDAYVGNENEIIAEVQKHPNARVFSFGIGSSVNRYLLDKMAEAGRGEVEYVGLKDDGSRAAKKFYERVRTPLLTDISIDWNGLPVADVYPRKLSDLFSSKPVILNGRYTKGASGTIRLKGKTSGQDYVREIAVSFPENEPDHDVLATLWARKKIDDLMNQNLKYDPNEDESYVELKNKTKTDIVQLALKYNLMTQFTSFVAVEERIVTRGGKTKTVVVPVELPEGVNRESINDTPFSRMQILATLQRPSQTKARRVLASGAGIGYGSGRGSGSGSGTGSGSGSGIGDGDSPSTMVVSGGVISGKALNLEKPVYPQTAKAAAAKGAVNVQILIDENGNVIFAKAISGHPLLRPGAEAAARASKFTPTIIAGNPVKVTGVIVYNFVESQSSPTIEVGETSTDEKAVAPLAADLKAETERLEKRKMLAEKLHFWVFALIERPQTNVSAFAANEAKFVKDGKAEVQIRMTEKSFQAFNRFRELGFEIIEDKKAKIVIGRIAVGKLAALVEIAEIQYIFPSVR